MTVSEIFQIGNMLCWLDRPLSATNRRSDDKLIRRQMHNHDQITWPSGDCKSVIATLLKPAQLAAATGALVFKIRDDLDWFEGASFEIEGLGPVLIMKHEGNPLGLTALYVDLSCDAKVARRLLVAYFGLPDETIVWHFEAG